MPCEHQQYWFVQVHKPSDPAADGALMCAACAVDMYTQALLAGTEPIVMRRLPVRSESADGEQWPCEHWDDQVGTVAAGDPNGPVFSSVTCCPDCVTVAQRYVQERTGRPAGPLVRYSPRPRS